MKVRVTIEVDDRERRALAANVGRDGKADREDIERWVKTVVYATLVDLVCELDA